MKMQGEVKNNKPIQQVWEYVMDPDNLPKWLKDLEKYERLTGDPKNAKPGDTGKHIYNQNGRMFVMDEKITACEAPHHVKLLLISGMFDMEIVNDLKKIDANSTKLASSAEFVRTGLVMKAVLLFSSKAKLQASHEEQLEKLKKLIEES